VSLETFGRTRGFESTSLLIGPLHRKLIAYSCFLLPEMVIASITAPQYICIVYFYVEWWSLLI